MHWLLNAVLWLAEELPTTEVIFDNNLAKWEKSSAKQNAKQYHWPSLSHSAHLSPRIRLFLILLTHNGDWNAKLQLRTKKQNAKKAKILRISKIYLASSPRCSIEVFWEFRCCLDLAITGGNRKKFCFFLITILLENSQVSNGYEQQPFFLNIVPLHISFHILTPDFVLTHFLLPTCCSDPPLVKLNWCPSHVENKPRVTPSLTAPTGCTHFPLFVCFRLPLLRINSNLQLTEIPSY